MLSELAHCHQAHQFPQSHHATYQGDYNGSHPISFAAFSPGRSQRSVQNASFRQRLERQQQYARPLRKTSSPPHQLLSSTKYSQDAEASEHLLRRKTPNGTLAAGYDGSPVEWTKRPHAMKHLLMPMPKASGGTTFSPSLPSEFGEHSIAHPTQSFSARIEKQQHQHETGIYSSSGGPVDNVERGAAWRSTGVSVAGIDSMLNQSSLQVHPFNLAASQHVPTVLQPMWPPCLGPTSIQNPGPVGPYWPDGAFVPYRPAPLRDPRFQGNSSNDLLDVLPQQQPNLSEVHDCSRADLQYPNFSDSINPPFSLPAPLRESYVPFSDSRSSSNAVQEGPESRVLASIPRQYGLARPYQKRPTTWNDERPHSLNQVYNDFGALSFDSSDPSLPPTQDIITGAGNAQFKERVLAWAHRVYCSLLVSIEQSRRSHGSGQHLTGPQPRSSYFPPPPRRPYPSWSSSQSRGYPHTLKGQMHGSLHDNIAFQKSSASASRRADVHGPSTARKGYSSSPSYIPPASLPKDETPQSWPPHNAHYWSQQSSALPSYIPPQMAQDHRSLSPQAAALYAMEILLELCKESGWEWTDGMLLNGCLAYGLGDYEKAREWYFKVVQRDPKNVEAMSNLAATLLSLGRRHDAEQYWFQSIKLRPSYFEAVEHLVGLLHEERRGRETVRVINYVEQILRSDGIANSTEHQLRSSGQYGPSTRIFQSGYAIPPSDNGRILALIHGKGNVLYQSGDNDGAARAFEDAILIGAGKRHLGIKGLIQRILRAFSERQATTSPQEDCSPDEPVLLPPDLALETSRLVFPPHGQLPGLEEVPLGMSQKAAVSIVSNSLLSLAKIYQDGMSSSGASATAPRATSGVQDILALYYLSLSLQPSPSTANNVGILLAGVQQSARSKTQVAGSIIHSTAIPGVVPGSGIALALAYYDYGLKLDPRHAHLYTNLGSLFKDIGQLSHAIKMYERAVACDGNFDIALANLANAVKDKGNIADAINYYKRAVSANPDFAEAVCGLANALNSVCSWEGRGGLNHLLDNRDRWHVDESGILYDSKKSAVRSSGWIERVVAIVDKQLNDGQNWGRGVLHSIGLESMLQQVCRTPASIQLMKSLRRSLESWTEEAWEGAKVVRLVERATKLFSWQMYQDEYVCRTGYNASLRTRPQLPPALAVPSAPTVLPFHTFTCPLSAKQIRKISQRNGLRVSCSTLRASWLPAHIYEPPAPPNPQLNVGYISSDFNNHPLAHLMQSVFGFHDPTKVKAVCYATTASDGSVHRQQIERESPVFHNASSWSIERLVNQVVADGIHILVNLNGYTRGAKNEVFAARPAPIQMSFMGFAGTLGAEWCDYLLADKVAIPKETLRPWRGNAHLIDQTQDGNNDDDQDEWVYGENIIFTKDTFFCCDHKQSAPDAQEPQLSWRDEQQRRWKMRKELFPDLADDAIILGNFNQLYKIEPTTFRTWLRILSRVPKAVLWLLRFPDLGEDNLKKTALKWVGTEVASRIIFTDVAPKHQHISRARVCDLFVDTPECNAHTTAADVLWSGTPLLTLPRYEYKMCSRMAASILRGALPKNAEGDRAAADLIVSSDEAYEEQGVELASDLVYPMEEELKGMGKGRLIELRKLLYESRQTSPLFDTRRWVRDLETAYAEAWRKWVAGEGGDIWL